jgi:hypothetical protein
VQALEDLEDAVVVAHVEAGAVVADPEHAVRAFALDVNDSRIAIRELSRDITGREEQRS